MVENLNSVIKALQTLEIQSTYDNMNTLLGCVQILIKVRDEITKQNAIAPQEVTENV